MKEQSPDAVLRPAVDGWELWRFPSKGSPSQDIEFSEKSLDSCTHLLLAVPTRSILAMPFWIASQGDATELAELELTSRHLLRKEAQVYTIPILEHEGRSLVLALAVVDDDTPHTYLKKAKRFEVPARLLPLSGADVAVWKEQGGLCFALYREDKCVFFASTGESHPSTTFAGAIARTVMRLRSESVITRMPARLRLYGDFLPADASSVAHALRLDFEVDQGHPAPILPDLLSDPAPPTARTAMESRKHLKRLASIATMSLSVYSVLLLLIGADLAWQRFQLHRLGTELNSIHTEATSAQKLVTEWKQFRSSIDPQTFAIDQLAAVATEIPGEQVRLTQYGYNSGRLSIVGEATDVSQAYEFFERVKKAPLLQDYDWTSGQPQLAGRNKVKFEMEGVRPDAKTSEE